ncbi:hypothetical protein ON010_g18596 [Phytophthora cinnamomi]|nr:hypothetical protein ON010_g18596 [Phytophthora cinnamomi]
MDADVTRRVFDVRHATSCNWVSKHSFYPKWIPFLEHMTPDTVLQSISAEFRGLFEVEELDTEGGVSIPIQFRTPTSKQFSTAASHSQVSRQKAVKIAKKSEGVKYLTTSVKMVNHGRAFKYAAETLFHLDEVKSSWNPVTQSLGKRFICG